MAVKIASYFFHQLGEIWGAQHFFPAIRYVCFFESKPFADNHGIITVASNKGMCNLQVFYFFGVILVYDIGASMAINVYLQHTTLNTICIVYRNNMILYCQQDHDIDLIMIGSCERQPLKMCLYSNLERKNKCVRDYCSLAEIW